LEPATTTAPAIKWLACNDQTVKARPQVKRSLSGWHKSEDRAKHARLKPSYAISAASVF
jgi:hypothetical protein